MYCIRATQLDDYGHTKQLNYGVEVVNVEVARKTQLIRKRAETDHRRAESTQPAKVNITEIEEILLPRSFRSRIADALKTPKVSTAIRSNT